MATSKVLPPLLVPIPKNHYSHYDYNSLSSSSKLHVLLRKRLFDSYFGDKTELGQPDSYYRLFKKRTADKKVKSKKPSIRYVLFTPDGTAIKAVKTLKRAKYLLASDSVVYRKIHRKEIPVGSYILKTEEDYANFNWEVPTIEDSSPVAVKRCKSCPQTTNKPGQCACGFWSAIRDSTHTKVWWTIHDRRMYDIRKSKEKKKVINVTVRLQDLLRKK